MIGGTVTKRFSYVAYLVLARTFFLLFGNDGGYTDVFSFSQATRRLRGNFFIYYALLARIYIAIILVKT